MGKLKPRLYPEKRQNQYGGICCPDIDKRDFHTVWRYHTCPYGENARCICKNNPHNCVKVKYHQLASRSDHMKNIGSGF